jgi:hypothetical protein
MPDFQEYPATTEEYRTSMMADPKGNPFAPHGTHGAAGHGNPAEHHGNGHAPAAATKGAH